MPYNMIMYESLVAYFYHYNTYGATAYSELFPRFALWVVWECGNYAG